MLLLTPTTRLRDARMQTYAQSIEEETESYCAAWGEEGEIELTQAMNELTVFNACRCLIGREFRQRASAPFAHSYHDLEAAPVEGGVHGGEA